MKQNHFYISYAGNKRTEVQNIYNNLDFTNIESVIEPYCGTCSISYYIWLQRPNLKFILNDNNKHFKEMYNIIKDDEMLSNFENQVNNIIIPKIKKSKTDYLDVVKKDDVYGWFISHKFYQLRAGLYDVKTSSYKNVHLKNHPIYDFFKNADIEFYNMDGVELYEKYKDDERNLIIFDPPYLMSCNDFYLQSNANIYEYLSLNKISNEKAEIYLILENVWIIKLLFKDLIKYEYDKKYAGHRKSTHLIIYNKHKLL